MSPESKPLPLQNLVREHKLASRHACIDLIESQGDVAERQDEARSLIRQLVMQRVFDKFSGEEEAALLDRLWPLAHSDNEGDIAPVFGEGAYDMWQRRGASISHEPPK